MHRINDHIRRKLPAVIVVILLFALPSCDFLKQKLSFGKYSLKSATEWARRDSVRFADSLKRIKSEKKDIKKSLPDSIKKVISNKKAFEKALTDSLLSIDDKNPKKADPHPGYYIIIGSFTNHDNAKLAAGQYSGKGFKTTYINATNRYGVKMELVSVKIFKDHNAASVFLKEFQGKYDPKAWVYKED